MGVCLNLRVLSEKTVHHEVDPNLIAYCPSMDLVALVTNDQQIFIYRSNGQRVYSASQKTGGLKVESIQWKPNGKSNIGQLLAVAWSDGSIRLIGAESSKIVHEFPTVEGSSGITCMGWATNLTNRTSSAIKIRKNLESWSDLFDKDGEPCGPLSSLDLPRDLSLIDIEISLPKLSPLTSVGNLDDVFCSRSSLDDLFRPFDPRDNNSVDVIVAGTKEGDIHLSIHDSFVIGSFKSPISTLNCASQLILHTSHRRCSTHALLMKPTTSENLFFIPMDLRFISASSEYLSLLASRSTALHNLLRYIHQVQALMTVEWRTTQDLPNRFIRNINDTLGEKDDRNIVQALYHSVATGHTLPAVREWLVDELSDRGYKRWDKAVTTGMENLRRLIHESMLPALERCSVILSRFAGIAKFQDTNAAVGFSTQQIGLMMDTIACIHLVCRSILIQVVDELEHFIPFSAWLRYEIERLASDSMSSPDDVTDKEASIDHSKVLLYLSKIMTANPLSIFFADPTSEDENLWAHVEQGVPMFELVNKQLDKQERHVSCTPNLVRVDHLCTHLTQQANSVFAQVAETEKRNVHFGEAQDIGLPQANGPIDMKIGKAENSTCCTYIAYVPKGLPNTIYILRVSLSIESGISTTTGKDWAAMEFGRGCVKDLKFLDDDTMLVLWNSAEETCIFAIPYNGSPNSINSESGEMMRYTPETAAISEAPPMSFRQENTLKLFPKYNISTSNTFVPDRIKVRALDEQKKGDAPRIVIVSEDRLQYQVLELTVPSPAQDKRDGADDVKMV